mmetsp:Transcript_65882/g.208512  ORF Transcript_65882/g.208512 Transcript_65882/m.208512 type:complete len:205 (-) Transcript_65882:514-1128(-)
MAPDDCAPSASMSSPMSSPAPRFFLRAVMRRRGPKRGLSGDVTNCAKSPGCCTTCCMNWIMLFCCRSMFSRRDCSPSMVLLCCAPSCRSRTTSLKMTPLSRLSCSISSEKPPKLPTSSACDCCLSAPAPLPCPPVLEGAEPAALRRWIWRSRWGDPRMNPSLANSHLSGSTFRNPYVFSWRTKLEKLLCLKYRGRRSCAARQPR